MLNMKMINLLIIILVCFSISAFAIRVWVNYNPFYEDCASMSEWSSYCFGVVAGKCQGTYSPMCLSYYANSPIFNLRNYTMGNITLTGGVDAPGRGTNYIYVYELDNTGSWHKLFEKSCPSFSGGFCSFGTITRNLTYFLPTSRFRVDCLLLGSGDYCNFDNFYLNVTDDRCSCNNDYNCTINASLCLQTNEAWEGGQNWFRLIDNATDGYNFTYPHYNWSWFKSEGWFKVQENFGVEPAGDEEG